MKKGVARVVKVLHDTSIFLFLAIFSCRTNRTHLKEDFYAVGALTKGRSTNADYEDDIVRILGVESVSDITFFQGSKLEKQFCTPRHTKELPGEITTQSLTRRKITSFMGKLKCSL